MLRMLQRGSDKMLLRENAHTVAVADLENRLREKYPGHEIWLDMEYGMDERSTTGQIDLYRISDTGRWYFYEVKTGLHEHYKQAQNQFNRFKKHFPEIPVKGVYYHPDKGVRRLK